MALTDSALYFNTNVWLLKPVFVQMKYPWISDSRKPTPCCSNKPTVCPDKICEITNRGHLHCRIGVVAGKYKDKEYNFIECF